MIKKQYYLIKKTIQEDLIYIIGNYGIRAASFIFTILVAKKISPENYGIFGLATLVITYLTYLNFGSQYAINKELSINIDNKRVNAYAVINTILYSIIVAAFVLIVSIYDLFPSLRPFLYYLLLYPIFFNILEISNGILRAHNLSKKLGLVKVAGTIVVVVVTIYYFIVGVPDDPSPLFSRFLLFQFVEVLVSCIFLVKVYSFRYSDIVDSFDLKYLKYLIIQGLILSLYITIDNFTRSIDRLFIASFYTKAELGYYTFGVALQGPFLLAIGSVMYMDFSRALKKFNNTTIEEFNKSLKHIYKKLFLIWGITLIGAIVFCFFFLKFFLTNYWPSYFVVVVYIFNYITMILIFPYSSYYIANNLIFKLIKIIIVPNLINIILSLLIVLLGLPYIFIIIVTLPSNIIYYLFIKHNFEKNVNLVKSNLKK